MSSGTLAYFITKLQFIQKFVTLRKILPPTARICQRFYPKIGVLDTNNDIITHMEKATGEWMKMAKTKQKPKYARPLLQERFILQQSSD